MDEMIISNSRCQYVRLCAGAFLIVSLGATSASASEPDYSADPTHREIAVRALALAVAGGLDEENLPLQEVQDRLEAGAYLEDYEEIPGVVGRFFPDPWEKVPVFDFNGLLPLESIPLGSLADTNSGWRRGLSHGYDPVTGYRWPGSNWTTPEWAAAQENFFAWGKALELYHDGRIADAYECVGHLLHLLSDMSVPSHVKVVNHGASLTSKRSGELWDPDQAVVIVDEYERALSGGLSINNVPSVIPDLRDHFAQGLDSADAGKIPSLARWQDYFTELASFTASLFEVGQFYASPGAEGEFGRYRDALGNAVEPTQYGVSPPSEIGGRWTQFGVRTTARVGLPPDEVGPILTEPAMVSMARTLVPLSVEYCAGLILAFWKEANNTVSVRDSTVPLSTDLFQNYPNPFNSVTTIGFSLSGQTDFVLEVLTATGQKVATLADGVGEPGFRLVRLDASLLASGVYFYRLRAGSYLKTKKLILLR